MITGFLWTFWYSQKVFSWLLLPIFSGICLFCFDCFILIFEWWVMFVLNMYRIHKYKRDLSNRVYASDEARASATLKAEELESSLGADYPTFVKPMLQSHVTGGFWLVSVLCYIYFQCFNCYCQSHVKFVHLSFLVHCRDFCTYWKMLLIKNILIMS